jgi:hypothetical protein
MEDTADLARALRSAVALREKLVVVCVGPEAPPGAAEDVALLRALGARPAVVCASVAAAEALSAAVVRAGERSLAVPGTSALRAGAPGAPPVADALLVPQLCAIGLVPVVSPPVAGAGGEGAVEASADLVAAGLAVSVGAERLVFAGAAPGGAVEALLGAFGRRYDVARRSLLRALLVDGAPAVPAGAAA